MSDKRIDFFVSILRDELTTLRDNKFYGSVTHEFTIRGGKILEISNHLRKKIRYPDDLKGGTK